MALERVGRVVGRAERLDAGPLEESARPELRAGEPGRQIVVDGPAFAFVNGSSIPKTWRSSSASHRPVGVARKRKKLSAKSCQARRWSVSVVGPLERPLRTGTPRASSGIPASRASARCNGRG